MSFVTGKLYRVTQSVPVWEGWLDATIWLTPGQILMYLEFRYIHNQDCLMFLWNEKIIFMFDADAYRMKRIVNDNKQ
jgi:hypothetical protein